MFFCIHICSYISEYGMNKYCFNQQDVSAEYQRWKITQSTTSFKLSPYLEKNKWLKLLKWVFRSRKLQVAQTIQWPIEKLQNRHTPIDNIRHMKLNINQKGPHHNPGFTTVFSFCSTSHTDRVKIVFETSFSLVEQELPTLPEHLSSSPVFIVVCITRSLVLCVCL